MNTLGDASLSARERSPFRLRHGARHALSGLTLGLVDQLLALDRLDEIYARVRAQRTEFDPQAFCERVLEQCDIQIDWEEEELARIPSAGAVVCVSNHPFGFAEGLVLGALLARVRPDVRILVNGWLERIEELRQLFVSVDPFGGEAAARENLKGVRAAVRWLRGGGLLASFPAGEVASLDLRRRRVSDPAWNPGLARILRLGGAAAVPVRFEGRNSALFQLAGLAHPRLRTALLPKQFLGRRGQRIRLRIGRPVPAERLAAYEDESTCIDALRQRSELLARRSPAPKKRRLAMPVPLPRRREPARELAPIAPPEAPRALESELDALPSERSLVASGPWRVRLARANEVPRTLRELGRLREESFRAVGEGTGRARDLDRFDRHYWHLVLWHAERRAVVGAYRLGATDEILLERGLGGLYNHELFHLSRKFLESLGPCLEVGRSFVRPEDQGATLPLALLWRGIGRFIASRPRYRHLFGALSISADYHPWSRRLMVDFLEARALPEARAHGVRARRPYRPEPLPFERSWRGADARADLFELERAVGDIEDGRRVPPLLREYCKLGARHLATAVDPDFGHCVDALIEVDFLAMPDAARRRLLGPEGDEHFRALHAGERAAQEVA